MKKIMMALLVSLAVSTITALVLCILYGIFSLLLRLCATFGINSVVSAFFSVIVLLVGIGSFITAFTDERNK